MHPDDQPPGHGLDPVHLARASAELTADIREQIHREGWQAMAIFDPCGVVPTYVYTTGLYNSYHHPELVIAGLPPHQGMTVITCAVNNLVKRGTVLEAGRDYGQVLDGFDVRARAYDPGMAARDVVFFASRAFYGKQPPRLQLEWPDEDGRFPTDEGCRPAFRDSQMIGGGPR